MEELYRADRFHRGNLSLAGRVVGPGSIVAPLLTVASPDSRVIPASSVVPFHQAAASPEKELLWYPGDHGVALQHVGVLVGHHAHAELWPRIIQWMRRLVR